MKPFFAAILFVVFLIVIALGTASRADICTDFYWNNWRYDPYDYTCHPYYPYYYHYNYYHHGYRPYHNYRHFEGHRHYGVRQHEWGNGGHHRR